MDFILLSFEKHVTDKKNRETCVTLHIIQIINEETSVKLSNVSTQLAYICFSVISTSLKI